MPFETGAANDAFDLLSKLHDFINAQTDWVIDEYDTAADELHVHDSGASGYWALKAVSDMDLIYGGYDNHPGIACYTATGYDSNVAWDAQPNITTRARGIGAFVNTSVPAYWFFTDGSGYVHVAVRARGTVYAHLHLGLLSKFGSWTGGAYVAGVFVDSLDNVDANGWLEDGRADADIRADIDGETNFFLGQGESNLGSLIGPDFSGTNSGGDFARILDQVNEWNARAVFMPIYVKGERQDGSFNWSYLGYPPDIRVVNARYINPESTVTIGADEWLVLPFYHRDDAQDTADFLGFAYRKVP